MTTHDPRGGGRPRLIVALGDTAPQHASQREFDLLPGVTVIGSAPDADLRLEGLNAHQAEIRRDERDEYLYVDLGSQAPGRVDGQPASSKPLRTGDRIELGGWTLSFFREEFADHGIPGGGRQGGDPHPVQQEPRPRGTSPEGGSDRTAGDPGEYFLAAHRPPGQSQRKAPPRRPGMSAAGASHLIGEQHEQDRS